MKNEKIQLNWKGFHYKDSLYKIGTFIVNAKVTDKLETEFKGDISIDILEYDTSKNVSSYEDVMKHIKESKFGKIAFNNESKMLNCPTCQEKRYIKNKGCADTICPEFEILITNQ